MGEKAGDILIEFIDPSTGSVKGHFLLETGEGSMRAEQMSWAGDYLVINDDANRVLIYSISTGDVISRFFGGTSALSLKNKTIAIENAPGRLTVFDLETGSEVTRLTFTRPVTLMRFLDDGKRFFVLTSDQTAFMFDTAKFDTGSVDEQRLGSYSLPNYSEPFTSIQP
jgi:WD40 repeat protein